MALICGAQFVLQLDFSIVNVALPTIESSLHMAAAQLQWVVTGYALTFGSLLLVGGRLADLLGRRRLLALGLVLFAVASLACGLAQWPVMLIASRLVQGAAGALVSPAALSLLTTTNPPGPARIRALATWQATTAAGATAGIVAGGLLTQYLGWRAIFLVNPPLIAVMLIFVRRLLPASPPAPGSQLDYRGATLVTAAIACLIFGLSNGQQHGFLTAETVAALVFAVALGASFTRAEMTAATPMLPLALFSSRSRSTAVVAMVMIGAVLAGYVYFVSLFLQRALHFSPLLTGAALVPSTVTVVLMSTLGTRRLVPRVPAWLLLLAGLACLAGGQFWLAQVSVSSEYLAGVLPGLILTSLGIGLALPTSSLAITSGVPVAEQGLAGALFTTTQQAGAAVGLAILATVAAARTAAASAAGPGRALVAGYRLSFLIAGVIILLAGVLVTVLMRPRGERDPSLHQVATEGAPAVSLAETQLRRC
jgi:EmrB/QacA subfamily drug resistance transporter